MYFSKDFGNLELKILQLIYVKNDKIIILRDFSNIYF